MHNAAFAVLGLPHCYWAFHVRPDGLRAALQGALALDFGGLNLTVPHKQAAIPHLDRLTGPAERIGAVNTVLFEHGGMTGDNTDGLGFLAALSEIDVATFGEKRAPGRSVVLGSGGAARAVVDALAHEPLDAEVRWVSRAPAGLAAPTGVTCLDYEALASEPIRADLLVNATTVGMHGGPTSFPAKLDLETLGDGARVVDLVYPRPRGGLLDRAEQSGFFVQDGLPTLLWQGVYALARWLERTDEDGEPPLAAPVIEAMRSALHDGEHVGWSPTCKIM
jgi:shikimate dehydrogenase